MNASAQAPAASVSTEATPTGSSMDAALMYQLLLGELNVQGGEPGTGYSLMLDAARKTNAADLYQRAVDIALQSRAGDAALEAARAWKDAQPDSREAGKVMLQILIALNRADEIGALLTAEIADAPVQERAAIIAALPRYFARFSDKKQAAGIVERALAVYFSSPEAGVASWTTVGRMRLLAGNPEAALEAARQAQSLDPRLEGAAWLALEVMRPDQPLAEPVVRKFLDAQPEPAPEFRMAFARVLLNAQRHAEALVQLRKINAEHPAYASAWLALGLLQVMDNPREQAEASLTRYLDLTRDSAQEAVHRGRTDAFLALSRIAERRRDYVSAERWIDRVENPDERINVRVRRASLLAGQGELEKARALIRAWPGNAPADARIKLLSEVQLLRDNKQFRAAYELLGQAIKSQPDDTDLLYDQAMVAERLGDFDAMERQLRKLMTAKPDYHHAYNALGYSLAERNQRLDEARQLIVKALEFAPDDPMIRDSLGWVEFRSGNMAQALHILQEAFKARPDADIAAHLGEVLWRMGQRDEARALWKQGLTLNPDNETLAETMKRLRVKE